MSDDGSRQFGKLVVALGPYRDHVIFVGGWAQRLYAIHERARPTDFKPLLTEDADIYLPADLPDETRTLGELLVANEFHERLTSAHRPPVARYELGEEDGAFYAEFLVDQRGSLEDRRGIDRPAATVSGVTAQRLPHLKMAATEPWSVVLPSQFAAARGMRVRVVNPASYMAHKILVLDKRAKKHRAKDVLYVHDTLMRFAPELTGLRQVWERVRPELSTRARREFAKKRDALLGGVTDEIRSAHRLAVESGRGAGPDPERILAVLRAGIGEVFPD